ncbi:MAG: hypothetical protein ACRELB_24005 [Polyangiaceae bacterium]
MRRMLLLLASMTSLAAAACSNSTGGSGGPGVDAGQPADACVAFQSDADLTAPTVAFSTDILPTFQRSCGIAGSTCHGARSVTTQQRPFLGFPDGGTDAGEIVSDIVGVAANEDPSLNLVVAGDPGQSYLMHKLDGDVCQFAAACAQGPTQYTDCGQQMPYSSPPLDESTRDVVRRWIAQGAQSN